MGGVNCLPMYCHQMKIGGLSYIHKELIEIFTTSIFFSMPFMELFLFLSTAEWNQPNSWQQRYCYSSHFIFLDNNNINQNKDISYFVSSHRLMQWKKLFQPIVMSVTALKREEYICYSYVNVDCKDSSLRKEVQTYFCPLNN